MATRAAPSPSGRPLRDREAVLVALEHGLVRADDTIRIGARIVTVGRYLVSECLPAAFRGDVDAHPCTARTLAALLSKVARDEHVEIAARSAEALELLGRSFASRSGQSIALRDFVAPPETASLIAEARSEVAAALQRYEEGLTTDGERYARTIDTWAVATERTRYAAKRAAPDPDPLAAFAAADVAAPPPERLRAIPGVCAKERWGETFEVPVLRTLAEGLSAHEYMMTTMAARASRLEQRERERVAAALLADLHTVLADVTIVSNDCGTTRGVRVGRLEHDLGVTVASLAARAEGRVLVADASDPQGALLARAGALLTRKLAARIDASHVPWLVVRDPLTCEAERGVCAACFGLDPVDATWPSPGDEVGARAAIEIARAARTFETRGVFLRNEGRASKSIGGGRVRFAGLRWIACPDRPDLVGECTERGTLEVLWKGKVMEWFEIDAGDEILVSDGADIEPETHVVRRDWERRLRAEIPAEVEAFVRFSAAPVGETLDEVTGLSHAAFPPGDEPMQLEIVDSAGSVLRRHLVPRDAIPVVHQGARVRRGDVLVRIPWRIRRAGSLGDLRSLRAFLDARYRDRGWFGIAAVAPCDGRVERIEPKWIVLRARDGRLRRVRRRKDRPNVEAGDEVRAGDRLNGGDACHDALLRAWGEERLAAYMLDELETETLARSLPIPRVYWGLVVRAMLGWRRILQPGESGLRRHQVLSQDEFRGVQREASKRGAPPLIAVPAVRGIAAIARALAALR